MRKEGKAEQGGVRRSGRTKLYFGYYLKIAFGLPVCLWCTSKNECVSPCDLQGFEEMFCLIGSDGSQYTQAGSRP